LQGGSVKLAVQAYIVAVVGKEVLGLRVCEKISHYSLFFRSNYWCIAHHQRDFTCHQDGIWCGGVFTLAQRFFYAKADLIVLPN